MTRALGRRLGDDAFISPQGSIRLPDQSEPEPDIALVRPDFDDSAPPLVADVFLVIEVADSSRDYDRRIKLPLYAAAGVPETWIFDLVADEVERHSELGPDGYERVARAGRGKTLRSTVVHGLELSIDDVLRATG